MVAKELPQLTAYPLEFAKERLREEGCEVKVIKSLPPGFIEKSDVSYRVMRQRLIQNKLVELEVTIDSGKRG